MNKETVALNHALWCKDESKKTIYIKGLKAKNKIYQINACLTFECVI